MNDIINKIKNNINLFKYMNNKDKIELLKNKDIFLELLKNDINILQYVGDYPIDNKIMLEAININPNSILFATEENLNNTTIIYELINKNIDFFSLASNELKSNKAFAKTAISKNKTAYKYISNSLKNDKEILDLIKNDNNLINMYRTTDNSKPFYIKCEYFGSLVDGPLVFKGIRLKKYKVTPEITIEDFVKRFFIYNFTGNYNIISHDKCMLSYIGEVNNTTENKTINILSDKLVNSGYYFKNADYLEFRLKNPYPYIQISSNSNYSLSNEDKKIENYTADEIIYKKYMNSIIQEDKNATL